MPKGTEDRFEVIESQGRMDGARVLRDRQTGVCYLFYYAGTAGGLTALLDANGAPVVIPVEDR